MTNFEKYRKDIEKIKTKHEFTVDTNYNVVECDDITCSDCIFKSLRGECSDIRLDWLFKEYKPRISADERALVKNVGIAKNVKLRYIARDKNGFLYLYEKMPSKDGDMDIYTLEKGYCLEIHETLFPWIQYSDGVYDIETSQFINVE